MITASVVSHNHGELIPSLIEDLHQCPEVSEIIVTKNVPEAIELHGGNHTRVVANNTPCGYGTNQNAAFKQTSTPFFCVLNADIRLIGNPFPRLLECFEDSKVAACAPIVLTPSGMFEDSAREFPSPLGLAMKAVGLRSGIHSDPVKRNNPDWLAGMFLLLRSSTFRELGGFDERFFLYYEDVDICWRMRRRGCLIRQAQDEVVIHDARRSSRRNLSHARWHLISMARYFWKRTME